MLTLAGTARADELRDQAQTLLQQMFATVDAVSDYQLSMSKQQRYKGDLPPAEQLQVKHRREPECSYFKWTGTRHQGREMIYCPQRYDGLMQAHESGLMGFMNFSIKPDGDFYKRTGQLHSVADTGLFALSRMVRKDYDYTREHPELPAPTLTHRAVLGAASTCIESEQGAVLFDTYVPGRRLLCIDDRQHLPTELQVWNTAGELMERYQYSDYRINAGLSDQDFDTKNPAYHF